jgi:hypothetical protein
MSSMASGARPPAQPGVGNLLDILAEMKERLAAADDSGKSGTTSCATTQQVLLELSVAILSLVSRYLLSWLDDVFHTNTRCHAAD